MTLPTISIKGKDYVQVKDRILYFNDTYPNGSINTELISPIDSKTIVVKATVYPDTKNPERSFSDYSQTVIGQGIVNQTAAMENASTSAVGRALGFMGIGIIESVASADEVVKATAAQEPKQDFHRPIYADKPISDAQVKLISLLLNKKGQSDEDLKAKYKVESKKDLTMSQASTIIDNLNKLEDEKSLPERDINEEINPDEIPDFEQ